MSQELNKKCDCNHMVKIKLPNDVPFAKIYCGVCGGLYFFKIGQYILKKKLGEGSSSSVYLAKSANKQKVVLKILEKPEQLDLDHFMRECMIQQNLEHPNIIKMLDQGHWENFYYLVIEYFEGKTLDQIIKSRGPLAEKIAVKIILAVLQGLLYSNQKKIVHRDIKPENIYVTDDGKVKILDMGLAKITQQNYGLTNTGILKGSPCYMAPEQFDAAKDVDICADIYSVGATLYHALCGEAPFDQNMNLWSIVAAKRKNLHKPLSEWKKNITPSLVTIVEKAMSAKQDRYQSIEDISQDLYDFYQGK